MSKYSKYYRCIWILISLDWFRTSTYFGKKIVQQSLKFYSNSTKLTVHLPFEVPIDHQIILEIDFCHFFTLGHDLRWNNLNNLLLIPFTKCLHIRLDKMMHHISCILPHIKLVFYMRKHFSHQFPDSDTSVSGKNSYFQTSLL